VWEFDGRSAGESQNAREFQVRLGGVFRLAEVKLQEGETLENALRRFKRKVQQEDIIKEVKRHSFYLKPGEKLRVKQALARKRNRKKSRREVE
jgi:small subunit ribosomal protein S21